MESFLTVVGGIVVGIIGLVLFAILAICPVWWGWNTFAHDLLGLPAIQYWYQALALSFILSAAKGTCISKSS